MSIVVKNDDKETVTETADGKKLTVYTDVDDTTMDDLPCPFCDRNMDYETERIPAGMGRTQKVHALSCPECHLKFSGIENRSNFTNFEAFYKFVKDKIES